MFKNISIFFLLCVGSLSALPIRNIAEPCSLKPFLFHDCDCAIGCLLGIDADYVFQYHFQVDHDKNRSKIEHTQKITNAAYLAVTMYDRFEIFTTLGGSRFHLKSNVTSFDPNPDFELTKGQRIEIESSTDFSWSVGARGMLWGWKNTFLGVEGEYFSTHPNVHYVSLQTISTANPSGVNIRYHEGQFGLAIVQNIADIAFPYLGVKWSFASMRFGNAPIVMPNLRPGSALTLLDLENSGSFGYAVGLAFSICERFNLTIEWRMNNEEALYINGLIRF